MAALKSRRLGKIAVILVSLVSLVRGAQSTHQDDVLAKETQARGYWVDPSSGLMWAAKDNGRDINWHQATSYCQRLRLGAYADWRLATIDELEELIDIKAFEPVRVGNSTFWGHSDRDRKVHGGLLLTGREWSSSPVVYDGGSHTRGAWSFDFVNVRRFESGDEADDGLRRHNHDQRALCVRDSNVVSGGETGTGTVVATYADPTTGLTWTARDNERDVNLPEAMKYCQDLRADGRSDWRLGTIEELESIYASAKKSPAALALTGDPWSRTTVETTTHTAVWYLSGKTGTRVFDDPSFSRPKRAVCVRGTGQMAPRSTTWIDPETGLMWTARDSLKGSSSYLASHCEKLWLAWHDDWRLPSADELQGIYDPQADSPGAIPRTPWQKPEPTTFHVKGHLFLTGMEWVNSSDNDDWRNPSHDRSVFDFKGRQLVTGKHWEFEARAICVRGKGK